jgi:hypothetical protein
LVNADTAVRGVRGDIFNMTELPARTAGMTAVKNTNTIKVAFNKPWRRHAARLLTRIN